MRKIIYHGSDHVIDNPEYGKGKAHNDYGRGFYCTENAELAKEWACALDTDGFANKYELNTDGLRILDLNDGSYSILNWLALLAKHRTYWQRNSISEQAKQYIEKEFLIDVSEFDIIKGYRADDSYFTFAKDFVSGAISLRKLNEAMHLGKLGEQIMLRSEKAFEQIKFIGSVHASAKEYYAKKTARDVKARQDYRKTRERPDGINEIFILDILREEIKNGDPRLL